MIPHKHKKLLHTNSTPHTKHTPIVLPLVHTLHLIASTHTHTPYTLHPYSIRPLYPHHITLHSIRPLYPHHITLHTQHPFQFRPSTARTHTLQPHPSHYSSNTRMLDWQKWYIDKTNNIYKTCCHHF